MLKIQEFIRWLVKPLQKLWRLTDKYPIPIVGTLGTLLIVGLIVNIWFFQKADASSPGLISEKAIESLLLVVLLFASWFVSIFTGPATDKKVDFMIRYCYAVTLFLLASFSVFFFFPVSASQDKDFQWPEFSGPVGIVLGCTNAPKSDYVPASDEDERNGIQIASNAYGAHTPGPLVTAANDAAPAQKYRSVTPKWLPKEIECGNNSLQWLLNMGGKVIPYHAGSASTRTDTASVGRPQNVAQNGNGSLGGQRTQANPGPQYSQIQGGLVVPLYFIVIALIGGLVSIMRRIPEYQARVSANSVNRLSNEEAREQLVFQLMQLLSAPLIAATAYYLIDPSTRNSSIALAFVAGFSSETVLLYIRALTSKLQPEKEVRVPIIVSPSSVDFGRVPVAQQSAASKIVVHNRGTSPVKVASITPTGDAGEWVIDANAAQNLQPGATIGAGMSASIDVIFTPKATGARQGTITISDDAVGSPRIIALSGQGT